MSAHYDNDAPEVVREKVIGLGRRSVRKNYYPMLQERLAADEALRQAEDRYERLLDISPVPIAIYTNGVVRYANRAAIDVMGATRSEELVGHYILDFVHPDDREAVTARSRLMAAGEPVDRAVERFIRVDGRTIEVDVTITPVVYHGEPSVQVLVRDITQRKRSRKLLDALRDMEASIHGRLDAADILRSVAVEAVKALDADDYLVVVPSDGGWRAWFECGSTVPSGEFFGGEEFRAPLGRLEVGTAVSADDAQGGAAKAFARRLGARTAVLAPVVVADRPAALLVFAWSSTTQEFAHEQQDFLGRLSSSVSLSLQNVELYQAERHIADTLQEALLTLPRELRGVNYAHRYKSATDIARVGGDFYDLFELDDRRIGIVVGDISGKGLEAAALTSIVKSGIRANAMTSPNPAEVMDRVNHLAISEFAGLEQRFGSSVFATAFFGVLDVATGTLVYCDAGHPPPLVVDDHGGSRWLAVDSPLLGVVESMSYAQDTTVLGRRDTLLLYTDGVIEAHGPAGMFGDERLRSLFRDRPNLEPEEICESVFAVVEDFSGGTIADDIALLTLRSSFADDAR